MTGEGLSQSDRTMCGRYSLICIDDLGRRFRVHLPTIGLRSRFNVAPGAEMPVIMAEAGENHLIMMRWGLVPSWAKDPVIGRRLINARAETLAEKPSFRSLIRKKRCLVPVDGFYEWRRSSTGRIPYYIRRKDASLFGFAGLYDEWRDPAGSVLRTYTIITTGPNPLISPIHDRMPAIVREDDEAKWLGADPLPEPVIREILAPYPADALEAYPVPPDVNSPASEGGHLILRLLE